MATFETYRVFGGTTRYFLGYFEGDEPTVRAEARQAADRYLHTTCTIELQRRPDVDAAKEHLAETGRLFGRQLELRSSDYTWTAWEIRPPMQDAPYDPSGDPMTAATNARSTIERVEAES